MDKAAKQFCSAVQSKEDAFSLDLFSWIYFI